MPKAQSYTKSFINIKIMVYEETEHVIGILVKNFTIFRQYRDVKNTLGSGTREWYYFIGLFKFEKEL